MFTKHKFEAIDVKNRQQSAIESAPDSQQSFLLKIQIKCANLCER